MIKEKTCKSCFIPLAPHNTTCRYCTPLLEEEEEIDDISQEVRSLLSPLGVTLKVLYEEEQNIC
jgi:hypothetical protein